MPNPDMSNWKELLQDYPVSRTPRSLKKALEENPSSGEWVRYGFRLKYYTETDGDVLVVNTDSISRSGYCAGGHYLVNANNMSQCVEEF